VAVKCECSNARYEMEDNSPLERVQSRFMRALILDRERKEERESGYVSKLLSDAEA
jgi:hypothetical protein